MSKKMIFSLIDKVDNVEDYKQFNEFCSYYTYDTTKYNRFNFIGADRLKKEIFYSTNDLLSSFYETQLSLCKKATMMIGTFENKPEESNEDSNGLYEKKNIIGCVNGTIMNKNKIAAFYGTEYSTDNSFIVNAYEHAKFYLRDTISNMSLILNELDGEFSIVLIDMEISKAFIYRRNLPLYCKNNSKSFFILNNKINRPQVSFENDLIYIPNKTCFILDLKTMQIINYKKIDNFDLSLNRNLTMKVFKKEDVKLLNKHNDSDYYYTIIDKDEEFPFDDCYKKILNRLTVEKFSEDFIENTDLQNYEFVIRSLNFALKNDIGKINFLNVDERNCEIMRIFRNVIENFSYDIEVNDINE